MVGSIAERVNDLERRVEALETDRANPRAGQKPTEGADSPSPAEFLLMHPKARSKRDVALVAGHFVKLYEGRESFDHDDLARFLGGAKVPLPKNRRDLTYQNVRSGYFREVGLRVQSSRARNRWSLSPRGVTRVENLLTKGNPGRSGGQ
jgi:hypothetical protein